MTFPSFETLMRQADRAARKVPVAAVGGDDDTVIEAMAVAAKRNWVRPILLGNVAETRRLAVQREVSLAGWQLIDTTSPAEHAVALVHDGQAKALVKGRVATPDLMRAVLDRERGLRTDQTVCQIVMMEIPRDGRRFLMTDTGITILPNLQQAESILRGAITLANRLGVDHPTVAVMAATEKVNEKMPETLLASQLQAIPSLVGLADIGGPLSFDLAYSARSGQRKGINEVGVGSADIMLFPSLLSANLTVKAIMMTADCRFGGLLSGVACPVGFMSRSDDAPTRINTLALTLGWDGVPTYI